MAKQITIEQIKRGMERMFIPNINITWDDKFCMYLIKAHVHTYEERQRLNYTLEYMQPWQYADDITDVSGETWLTRYSGIKMKQGRYIAPSFLDSVLNSLGACGLTYEITDKPDNDETG